MLHLEEQTVGVSSKKELTFAAGVSSFRWFCFVWFFSLKVKQMLKKEMQKSSPSSPVKSKSKKPSSTLFVELKM